jgi:alkylation response protein AidB-like acyl-CoA dehydrogenase
VRRLSQEKIKPRARQIDSSGEYPQDLFDEFKKADLLGLCIPVEYGGSGRGMLGLTVAIEEVTKYSNVLGLMLLFTRLPTGPIMIAGTEEQKQRYLPASPRATSRAAFCLSEPGAGSDVAGMQTSATPDPDVAGGFILNGTKCWISGGHAGRLVHRLRQDRRSVVEAAHRHLRFHRRREQPRADETEGG